MQDVGSGGGLCRSHSVVPQLLYRDDGYRLAPGGDVAIGTMGVVAGPNDHAMPFYQVADHHGLSLGHCHG